MKSRAAALVLLVLSVLLVPSARAQIHARYHFTDSAMAAQGIKKLTITPLLEYTVYGSTNLATGDPVIRTVDANGLVTVSNLISGSYRVEFSGARVITTFTNSFGTNVTGLVNALDPAYLTISTNLNNGQFAYSQAAANSNFVFKSGDTMTGSLFITGGNVLNVTNRLDMSSPTATRIKPGSGNSFVNVSSASGGVDLADNVGNVQLNVNPTDVRVSHDFTIGGIGRGDGSGFTNLLPQIFVLLQTNASTADFQAALANGGRIEVQPGTYTFTTNLVVSKPGILFMNHAVFKLSGGLTNSLFSSPGGGTNGISGPFVVRDGDFDGGDRAQYDSSSFYSTFNGSVDPYYNANWTNRSAIRFECSGGVLIQNCRFYGWGGAAVSVVNTNNGQAHAFDRAQISNCRFFTNFIACIIPGANYEVPGFYLSLGNPPLAPGALVSSEYCSFSDNFVFRNQFGLVAAAGNTSTRGNQFTANGVGVLLASGPNPGHGINTGNQLNHNAIALYGESTQGGNWVGNDFFANTGADLIFNAVVQFQVAHNNMSGNFIIMTNGSSGDFKHNFFVQAWPSVQTNFTGSTVRVAGNTCLDGTSDGSVEAEMEQGRFFIYTNGLPAGLAPMIQANDGTFLSDTNGRLFIRTNRQWAQVSTTPPFDPLTISGLAVLYDMQRAGQTVGATIHTNVDASGNSRDARDANLNPPYATNQAGILNGIQYEYFSGVPAGGLQTNFPTLTQPITIFAVSQCPTNDGGTMYDGVGAAHTAFMSSGSLFLNCGSQISTKVNTNQFYIFEFVANGASSFIKTNGVKQAASGNVGANSLQGLTLAATRSGLGNGAFGLAYFVVITNAVSAANETNMFQYLNNRFGVY